MKELILFSFVVLFIACQNQQIPDFKAGSKAQPTIESVAASAFEAMACGNESTETLDVVKELENPKLPGIHYREVALRSELASELNQAELVCVSQVSNSHEEETTALDVATEALPAQENPESAPNTWAVLTEKWEITPENKACQLQLSNAPDAKCEGPALWTEEGKLFSARFENSFNQM